MEGDLEHFLQFRFSEGGVHEAIEFFVGVEAFFLFGVFKELGCPSGVELCFFIEVKDKGRRDMGWDIV